MSNQILRWSGRILIALELPTSNPTTTSAANLSNPLRRRLVSSHRDNTGRVFRWWKRTIWKRRLSSFVLPRPMSNFSTLEDIRDTPGEWIHSLARLSFPTSIYENIRSFPLFVSGQPTNGETPLSGLFSHTATDSYGFIFCSSWCRLCTLGKKPLLFWSLCIDPPSRTRTGKRAGTRGTQTTGQLGKWLNG